jgi:murein DD-endopeptidase MepM/ murein hydrolase activator NlpD
MFRWYSPFTWWVGSRRRLLLLVLLLVLLVAGYRAVQLARAWQEPPNQRFIQWWQGEPAEREALITVQREACPGAPFILPADGYIGLLYGDPRGPYSDERPHQGIDIFSSGEPGETPVYAAYDGYLTREENWRSSVIIRVPDDPLRPGRQIWLYYTHMADRSGENDFIEDAFPPGTREKFVPQGTLLGYTGDYNGNALRTVWVHLHFSIVLDDSNGSYRNELEFANTLDPSPYLAMPLNQACAAPVVACTPNPACAAGP